MAGELENAVVPLVARILRAELVATPAWLLRPAEAECRGHWPAVRSIYHDLTALDLPEEMPPRETRRVDAVLDTGDGTPRILEVDETQHFNRYRALTLRDYPADAAIAFPIEEWITVSDKKTRLEGGGFGKPKRPLFPAEHGRHAQRAFRDMLADLLHPSTAGSQRCGSDTSKSWTGSTPATPKLACASCSPEGLKRMRCYAGGRALFTPCGAEAMARSDPPS